MPSVGRSSFRVNLELIAEALHGATNHEHIRDALELATERLYAERGVMILNQDGPDAMIAVGDDTLNEKFPFSSQLVENLLTEGRGMVSFAGDPGGGKGSVSMEAHGIRLAMCAAINRDGNTIGLVYFDSRTESTIFRHQDIEFVRTFAGLLAKVLP